MFENLGPPQKCDRWRVKLHQTGFNVQTNMMMQRPTLTRWLTTMRVEMYQL